MAIPKTPLQRPARNLMPLVLGAAFALWSSLCLADIPGYPSNIEAYDSREVAMLPHYCIYTQLFRERVPGGNNPAEIGRWRAMMGETFDASICGLGLAAPNIVDGVLAHFAHEVAP